MNEPKFSKAELTTNLVCFPKANNCRNFGRSHCLICSLKNHLVYSSSTSATSISAVTPLIQSIPDSQWPDKNCRADHASRYSQSLPRSRSFRHCSVSLRLMWLKLRRAPLLGEMKEHRSLLKVCSMELGTQIGFTSYTRGGPGWFSSGSCSMTTTSRPIRDRAFLHKLKQNCCHMLQAKRLLRTIQEPKQYSWACI